MLDQSRAERAQLSESLRGEANVVEEQRAYIAVLQEALRVKAAELGLGGQASLLTQLAELRGKVDSDNRELASTVEKLNKTEIDLQNERERNAELSAALGEQRAATELLDEEVAKYGGKNGAFEMCRALRELEKEKGALLDYVQDTADRVARLTANLDGANRQRGQLEKANAACMVKLQEEHSLRQTSEAERDLSLIHI